MFNKRMLIELNVIDFDSLLRDLATQTVVHRSPASLSLMNCYKSAQSQAHVRPTESESLS